MLSILTGSGYTLRARKGRWGGKDKEGRKREKGRKEEGGRRRRRKKEVKHPRLDMYYDGCNHSALGDWREGLCVC